MWHKNVKWARNETPPLKSGDTVEGGNMSQWNEDAPVLKGKNNLTFIRVNMRNIKGLDEGDNYDPETGQGSIGNQNLVLRREIDPKDGQEWLFFEKNIRCKGCLIMQKDIVEKPLPTPDDDLSNKLNGFLFENKERLGGEDAVIKKIADHLGLQKITTDSRIL